MLTNRTPAKRQYTRPQYPDSLAQIVSDLTITIGRVDGLATMLDGCGNRGGAVAAEHIAMQARGVRARIQRWALR